MIVVDTNVIAYLLNPGQYTADTEQLLKKDPVWLAPRLWRSEFRNVLVQYLRHSYFSFSEALNLMIKAEQLMRGKEYEISSAQALEEARNSSCSACDCEFVSLAKELALRLITTNNQILTEFPDTAISIQSYLSIE